MKDPDLSAVNEKPREATQATRHRGGVFRAGNSAAVGRSSPPRTTAEMRRALLAFMDDYDPAYDRTRFEAVLGMVYSKAMNGDREAQKFLVTMGAGKPVAQIEANYNVNRNVMVSLADRRTSLLERLAQLDTRPRPVPCEPVLEISSDPMTGDGTTLPPSPSSGTD